MSSPEELKCGECDKELVSNKFIESPCECKTLLCGDCIKSIICFFSLDPLCKKCNKYTMSETCKVCGDKTVTTKPPKFSPDDKYADVRRKVKREELEKTGLLN